MQAKRKQKRRLKNNFMSEQQEGGEVIEFVDDEGRTPTTEKLEDIKLVGKEKWWQDAPYAHTATYDMREKAQAGIIPKEDFIIMCTVINDARQNGVVDRESLSKLKELFKQYSIKEMPEAALIGSAN
jgi:hypothetical protein